jgi:hypothetical protein
MTLSHWGLLAPWWVSAIGSELGDAAHVCGDSDSRRAYSLAIAGRPCPAADVARPGAPAA